MSCPRVELPTPYSSAKLRLLGSFARIRPDCRRDCVRGDPRVVAVAFLVVGIIFCLEPTGSLPVWLGGHQTIWVNNKNMPSPGYHPLRAVGSLIAGVVFAIGA
jgi:hypothetical protein